jgi:hypothetical protein
VEVAGYEENRIAKKILFENLKTGRPFMSSRHRWVDHMRVDLKRNRR